MQSKNDDCSLDNKEVFYHIIKISILFMIINPHLALLITLFMTIALLPIERKDCQLACSHSLNRYSGSN